MNYFKLVLTFLLLPMMSFAQDELDDIFDDGEESSQFSLGTQLLTFIGGTPNLYVEYKPIEIFSVNVGVGIIPFNKHTDYTNIIAHYGFDIPLPITDTSLTGGNYFSADIKLHSNANPEGIFNYYYYLGIKQKNYSQINDFYKAKITRLSLGYGYFFNFPGKISLDFKLGIFMGWDKTYIDEKYDLAPKNIYLFRNAGFSNLQGERAERYAGLDFSIGINYSL